MRNKLEKKRDVLKMLFEEHHRQLAAKRQKIHSISERTLALLIVIAGWMIVTEKPLSGGLHWIIIVAVIIITGAACFTIYNNNRAYFEVASIIRKVNESLGFFEPNRFYPNEPLYPLRWKKFGERNRLSGFLPHWFMIIAAAILCVALAIMKVK